MGYEIRSCPGFDVSIEMTPAMKAIASLIGIADSRPRQVEMKKRQTFEEFLSEQARLRSERKLSVIAPISLLTASSDASTLRKLRLSFRKRRQLAA